jgi:hypothetical protein
MKAVSVGISEKIESEIHAAILKSGKPIKKKKRKKKKVNKILSSSKADTIRGSGREKSEKVDFFGILI